MYCTLFLAHRAGTILLLCTSVFAQSRINVCIYHKNVLFFIVESPVILTDTIIFVGDPLYEVPVTHTPEGMDPTTTSLCYQIHGETEEYYNIISDRCVQVNVLYDAIGSDSQAGNYIKDVGIVAHNTAGGCNSIEVTGRRCTVTIDGNALNGSYDQDGVTITKTGRKLYEIILPNCKTTQGDDLRFRLRCVKVNNKGVVRVDVIRNGGRAGAHGLLGKDYCAISH